MGYGIKIFMPRPLHDVTRSPGRERVKSTLTRNTRRLAMRGERRKVVVFFRQSLCSLLIFAVPSKHDVDLRIELVAGPRA